MTVSRGGTRPDSQQSHSRPGSRQRPGSRGLGAKMWGKAKVGFSTSRKIGSNLRDVLNSVHWWRSTPVRGYAPEKQIGEAAEAVHRMCHDLMLGNEAMKDVVLSYSQLGPKDMSLLSAAIVENLVVTEVDLRGNRLGDKGAQALAPGLAQSDTIVKLRVGQNGIGCRGAIALLTGNMLEQLFLDQNTINEDDISLAPKRLWMHPAAGSEGIEMFGQALGNHPTLETLSLSGNRLRCVGLARMCHGIQNMPQLMVLDLSNNLIGDKGATHLARALLVNNIVLDLNLSNNKIGDKGGKRLLQVLLNNNEIYRFDVGRNLLGDEVAKQIAQGVRHNQRVQVQERYVKPKTKRSEAPHTPQFHKVKTRVVGKHIASAMDDLVMEYQKNEGLGKYADDYVDPSSVSTPQRKGGKQPSDRALELKAKQDAAEEDRKKFETKHKAFVPIAYAKSTKNNALAKVTKADNPRFGRVGASGETVENEMPPSFGAYGV